MRNGATTEGSGNDEVRLRYAEDDQDGQFTAVAGGFPGSPEVTKMQIGRLQEAFGALGQPVQGETCKRLKGLIDEGEDVIDEKADPAAQMPGREYYRFPSIDIESADTLNRVRGFSGTHLRHGETEGWI